jgi:hypothetical protein
VSVTANLGLEHVRIIRIAGCFISYGLLMPTRRSRFCSGPFHAVSDRTCTCAALVSVAINQYQTNKQYFPTNIRRTSGGDAAISVAGGSRSGLGALHSQRITDDWGSGLTNSVLNFKIGVFTVYRFKILKKYKKLE